MNWLHWYFMIERLAAYNVMWDSPSADDSGTMPLGNGDLGINVRVDLNGDLLLLIGKTDAWDENSINLKLGRIRVTLEPNPLRTGREFRQTLDLATATIAIEMREVSLRVWVDANHPIIHIDVESQREVCVTATLEMWRTEPRTIKTQTGDLFKNLAGKNADPYPTVVSPDDLLDDASAVIWCHYNRARENDGYAINMRLQGLGGYMDHMPHPLLNRTTGAALFGMGFSKQSGNTVASAAPVKRHHIQIVALTTAPACDEPETIAGWLAALRDRIASIPAESRTAHEQWWRSFWERSWIFITSESRDEQAAVYRLTQAWLLQRFINTCGGRGRFPIKYNGSIFTVGRPDDPDYRRWGGPGFWFMNQRLIYWPMLAAGDFEQIRPWLQMYRDMLPLQQFRTRTYYNHAGAHYPETIMFWGAEVSAHYEWTPFEQRATPEAACAYVRYYWSGGIELCLILFEYFNHTRDPSVFIEWLVPIADAVFQFFDLHYPRDSSGKIRFEPAQSLETWHDATNPLPEIAGLRYLLPLLIDVLDAGELKDRCVRMLSELPEVPMRDGVLLAGERVDRKKNTENPELYAVFPYRLFGIGKPQLEVAQRTFQRRLHAAAECWSQDEIQMALLGLTDAARTSLIQRSSHAAHSESRFPAFWNAFHDWIPDMDHGGVLQMALQLMLMQCDRNSIRLLPAWPADWDVDFKLHAPERTTVEASVRVGSIQKLEITPPRRRSDVIIKTR